MYKFPRYAEPLLITSSPNRKKRLLEHNHRRNPKHNERKPAAHPHRPLRIAATGKGTSGTARRGPRQASRPRCASGRRPCAGRATCTSRATLAVLALASASISTRATRRLSTSCPCTPCASHPRTPSRRPSHRRPLRPFRPRPRRRRPRPTVNAGRPPQRNNNIPRDAQRRRRRYSNSRPTLTLPLTARDKDGAARLVGREHDRGRGLSGADVDGLARGEGLPVWSDELG